MMKKFIRVLSLILVLSMFVPLTQMFPLNLSVTAEEVPDIFVTYQGERIESVVLPRNERMTLSALTSGDKDYKFQWQILADIGTSLWANIYDMTSGDAEISYALLEELLDESNSAYIRCAIETSFGRVCSAPVCVTVEESAPVWGTDDGFGSPKRANGAKNGPQAGEYITIIINYLSAEDPDHHVYNSYTANVARDATFSQNVISPTQLGFAPFYIGEAGDVGLAEGESITVKLGDETRSYTYNAGEYINDETFEAEDSTGWLYAIRVAIIDAQATYSADVIPVSYTPGVDAESDIEINVYYKSIEVPYSVKYYFQNINDDGYTANAAISYNGMAKTGTIVSDEELYQPVLDYYGVLDGEDYGFSPLYHYPESVAADGSTVFECYYDRNYYLMKFDMDGGYGVEPIYARYGASFVVTPPTKPGYVFMGWDEITKYKYMVYTDSTKSTYITNVFYDEEEYKENGSASAFIASLDYEGVTYPNAYFFFDSASGDGVPDVATTAPFNFTGTMQPGSISYKAVWETVNTTYTIVYWAENADDSGYSYWGSKSVSAPSATVLSDYDAIAAANPASGASLTDSAYFTYNSAKTKFENTDRVIVEGDGSSIVNIYYSRNTYDILFYDAVGSCYVPEHTHSDACYQFDCTTEHVHDASCCRYHLNQVEHDSSCCSQVAHQHNDSCRNNCTIPVHTHTADCFRTICIHTHDQNCCSIEFHNHTSGCTYEEKMSCIKEEHTHSISSCYTVSGTYNRGGNYPISLSATPSTGPFNTSYTTSSGVVVYSAGTNNNNPLYYLLDGQYYALRANNSSITYQRRENVTNFRVTLSCSKEEHTHDANCYICPGYDHVHSVSCYPDATTTEANSDNYSTGRPATAVNGQIYARKPTFSLTTYRSIYYNGVWYRYNGSQESGTIIDMDCGLYVHTHAVDGSCCTKPVHEHTSGCNTDACSHVCSLENGCITVQCGYIEHTHSELCLYNCHKEAHTHDISCYTVGGSFRNYGNGYYFKLSGNALMNLSNATQIQVNGVTLYYNAQENDTYKYLYYRIGNQYYQLLYGTNTTITYNNYIGNPSRYSTLTIENTCNKEEHTHNQDSCYACGIPAHRHGYDECDILACSDSTHHIHTDECLQCGFAAQHVHSANCPKTLICTQAEHSHSDGTCRLNSSNNRLVYKITAKYQADIHAHWPINGGNGIAYASAGGYRWDPQTNGLGFSQVLVYMDRMPGMANETGKSLKLLADKATGRSNITMHYCVQTIPNDSTAQYINYLGQPAEIEAGKGNSSGYQFVTDYRRAGAYYNGITMDVDFIELEGFERYRLWTNQNVDIPYANNTQTRSGTDDYFYYLRKQYTLSFYNYNADWGNSNQVYYEQNMNPFNPGTPPYPSTLEPNAYRFIGWYTTPECYPGTEFDWTATNKMPAKDVKLYAKWLPVTHTVRFFETYDKMLEYEASVEAGTPDESLVYVKQSMTDVEYTRYVEHGSFVGSIPNPDKLIVNNPGGTTSEYDFNGWFTIENENKKAFTPLDMPITKDMNVFADWGSHTAQPYAVHYALNNFETDSDWLSLLPAPTEAKENKEEPVSRIIENKTRNRTYICLNDGTEESPLYRWHRVISDATRGYAYQGTTRTFAARAGDTYHQLYDAYDIDFNDRFYPTPASHSITMVYEENSLEPINNVFTFRYVFVEEVNYTVRYLDATTGDVLHAPKYVTTENAVVTERFVPITDYVPDAFYKQCILAVVEDPNHPGQYISSPENVITFYYSQNDTSARYTVHFMMQKADNASGTLNASDYEITFNEDGTYNYSSKFEESGSRIDGIADKDKATPINPMEFAGFDLVTDKAVYADGGGATHSVAYQNGSFTITPKVEGTDLFLFYTRERYPYKVYYLLYGTPVSASDLPNYTTVAADTSDPKHVLADTDGLSPNDLYAVYGTDYTANAKTIPGYVCVSAQTISKAITPIAANNYIIFFYTHEQYTVQYEVWSRGGGTLDNTIETVEYVSDLRGSTATEKPGYRFAGWFVDPECTVPAAYNASTNPGGKGTTYTDSTKATAASGANGLYVFPEVTRLIPNGQTGSENNIFYARFDPLVGELTVTRENSANEGFGTQTFIYEVVNNDTGDTVYVSVTGNDSVTIHDLLLGDYTVTQMNDWSHRFEDSAQDVTLDVPTGTTVTFDDASASTKWLNGNGSVVVNTKG